MTRLSETGVSRIRTYQHNFFAVLIFLTALGILVLNFHPQPVGAHLGGHAFAMGPEPRGTASPSAAPANVSAPAGKLPAKAAPGLQGRIALLLKQAMLDQGRSRLEKIPSYSATFYRQERLDDGTLLDGETIDMKLRHKPFSVYMKWLEGDVGREVLFVDGLHDNRMMVKKGGKMGALLPSLKLEPTGSLAMAESRHPVTEAGLLTLTNVVAKYCQRDLELPSGVKCELLGEEKLNNRVCYNFLTEYGSREIEPLYRKSYTYFDKETSLILYCKNYTWPGEAEAADASAEQPAGEDDTLLEVYSYSDVKFNDQIADNDFDHTNKSYKFKR